MTRNCKTCGEAFEVADSLDPVLQRLTRFKVNCEPCVERESAKADEAERIADLKAAEEARIARWGAFLHENHAGLMLDNDEERLAACRGFSKVCSWQYAARGLVLIGPTGASKTRMAFWLLHREFQRRRTVGYLSCPTLAQRLGAAANGKFGGDGQLLEAWTSVDLLLIDDLGKGGIGDRHEGTMFGIIDARSMAARPTIITQNAGGEALKAALSPDRAEPFLRRLRQFNDVISLG